MASTIFLFGKFKLSQWHVNQFVKAFQFSYWWMQKKKKKKKTPWYVLRNKTEILETILVIFLFNVVR